MKKYPIILALLLFFSLGIHKAYAVETVVKLITSDIFQQIPRPYQVKGEFNLRCNNDTSAWIDTLSIGFNENYALSQKTYSQCHGDLAIGSFAIDNIAPEFVKEDTVYFFLNFVVTLQEYSDSTTMPSSEGTGWLVRSTRNVDSAGATSWKNKGYSSRGAVTGFDTKVTYIGDADSQIYEDGSGAHYLAGGKMYLVEISGQLWPNSGLGGSGWDIMVGNTHPGYNINDIVTFSMPQYNPSYNFGYRMTIGHPNLYYLNPQTLDEVTRLSANLHTETDRILAAIAALEDTNQQYVDQITDNQTQIAEQQEQAAQQRQQEMMNDNTASGESQISSFMTSFDDGADPTLSGIITKPLELLQTMATTNCTPLSVTLPFVNESISLPCGRALFMEKVPQLMVVFDIITIGYLSYSVATNLFVMIHEFKNPDNDGNIQPLDL